MKRVIKHIGENSLKSLIDKANERRIDPKDFLQVFTDKGSYYLIFKGYEK